MEELWECKAVDGQAQCLEDQMIENILGLESRVPVMRWFSILPQYDNLDSITKRIQLLSYPTLLLLLAI